MIGQEINKLGLQCVRLVFVAVIDRPVNHPVRIIVLPETGFFHGMFQCRNQSPDVTENCYRNSIISVMTHLTRLVSTNSGDTGQNWTVISLGQTSGAFLSHVQQHFPDNVSVAYIH